MVRFKITLWVEMPDPVQVGCQNLFVRESARREQAVVDCRMRQWCGVVAVPVDGYHTVCANVLRGRRKTEEAHRR